MISDDAVKRAARLLGLGEDYLRATVLISDGEVYSLDERRSAAVAVLYARGASRELPGNFEIKLLQAFFAADSLNRGRLAVVFPVYADAIDIYSESGEEGLREWATEQRRP